MEKEQTDIKETEKKSRWFEAVLFGTVLMVFGILISFFPKMIASVGFIVAGVIFFFVGLTDIIASLQYKSEAGSWKSTLWAGLLSVLVSIFMVATIYMPNISDSLVLIVLCLWGVIRCLLMLIGVITGKVRRKGTILSAVVSGVAGILVFLFRDIIMASGKLIGYGLIVIGAVFLLVGLYQRAAQREINEKAEQKKKAAKLAEKEKEKEEKQLKGQAEQKQLDAPEEETTEKVQTEEVMESEAANENADALNAQETEEPESAK